MTAGFKQVYFHLLDTTGKDVHQTIEVDNFNKKVALDEWFAVEGQACLVQRIAFDHSRLDVFLKPMQTKYLN
jgi:hypothetical protein